MDILTVLGLLIGASAILGGNFLEGGHISSLFQGTAFLIVVGGTIGAVMVQYPLSVFIRSMRMSSWIFIPPKIDFDAQIKKIIKWSHISRKEGLLGLERFLEIEKTLFIRKSLQLVVDGNEPDSIRKILEVDIDANERSGKMAARVFESMGGYSPTIGIIGAVMGLIHVMNNLADPSKLGAGIAVAFVATIYGVGFANLFFLPVANKLKMIVSEQAQLNELITEGIVSISEGENPRIIETKLQGFLH
ncbi:MAG: flagellar motor protein [Gammaproteobacteria bacterium]|nr:flagellar motor protein [Gammaproteobacteria bacterium]